MLESVKGNSNPAEVKNEANRDPLTGTPGAHPAGVGTGALGGGLAGAAVGAVVAGPIGAGVGAFVGAVSGGLAGKGAAEALNPTAEHEYWRIESRTRPYFTADATYEEFAPAYQLGWESYGRHQGKTFNDVQAELSRDWDTRRGESTLGWNHAKHAAQDAWQRAEEAACGERCSL